MDNHRREMILKYLDLALETESQMFFLAVEMGRLAKGETPPVTSAEINQVVGDELRKARGVARAAQPSA